MKKAISILLAIVALAIVFFLIELPGLKETPTFMELWDFFRPTLKGPSTTLISVISLNIFLVVYFFLIIYSIASEKLGKTVICLIILLVGTGVAHILDATEILWLPTVWLLGLSAIVIIINLITWLLRRK